MKIHPDVDALSRSLYNESHTKVDDIVTNCNNWCLDRTTLDPLIKKQSQMIKSKEVSQEPSEEANLFREAFYNIKEAVQGLLFDGVLYAMDRTASWAKTTSDKIVEKHGKFNKKSSAITTTIQSTVPFSYRIPSTTTTTSTTAASDAKTTTLSRVQNIYRQCQSYERRNVFGPNPIRY